MHFGDISPKTEMLLILFSQIYCVCISAVHVGAEVFLPVHVAWREGGSGISLKQQQIEQLNWTCVEFCIPEYLDQKLPLMVEMLKLSLDLEDVPL